ncbi:helix-turn-helix domain-containing protein [Enterococcus faecalis]|uniref:helix-turn-helix domain-containing protein n=1 Tax=Enterococcus faecalis TaxID=1351 RepID=UPI0034CDCCF1
MRVYGDKIKIARKEKKMSQVELAKGICTQATISNIEKKNICDSLDIFASICLKLNLELADCLEMSDDKNLDKLLNEVESLCLKKEYNKAYELLLDWPTEIDSKNSLIQSKFYFFKGLTSMFGKKDLDSALFSLHQGTEVLEVLNIYNVLCVNVLGLLYENKNQFNRAKIYYDKSIKLLEKEEISSFTYEKCYIYCSVAKFYSMLKDYVKSLKYCDLGIDLNVANRTIYSLDELLYEKAKVTYNLKKNAKKEYLSAYHFSDIFNNEILKDKIMNDLNRLNIDTKY